MKRQYLSLAIVGILIVFYPLAYYNTLWQVQTETLFIIKVITMVGPVILFALLFHRKLNNIARRKAEIRAAAIQEKAAKKQGKHKK